MSELWPADTPGLLRLPSGRVVRGRPLSKPVPDGAVPTLGVYLLGKEPAATAWPARWVQWPDFGLPRDRDALRDALQAALVESDTGRVEFGCGGGRGRTGTALACLAVLDGVPAAEAVAYVRQHYSRHAVETPWQRGFVKRFS
ncbi:protein-tyrosine phosphatase family protein [Dactylosporangium siamense]|uniref:Protein-tyrosine-phosphatase n=1 Tax=Dactylosporangium siamense TaxID=685454 RepID=A0A919PII0_9ACTN|nr:protein-tyrosine phosphatase family protein [Dactylosporangium siamense]GIG42833.1 protein-tyrosine-phosphatase [Dactylosporangium siamense]